MVTIIVLYSSLTPLPSSTHLHISLFFKAKDKSNGSTYLLQCMVVDLIMEEEKYVVSKRLLLGPDD